MTFLEKIKAKRAAENGAAVAPAVQTANEIVNNATEKTEKKASPLQGILARKKAAEAAKAANKEAETAASAEEAKKPVAEEAPAPQAEEKVEAKSEAEPKAEAPAEKKQEEAVKAEEQPTKKAKEEKAEEAKEEKVEEAPATEEKAEETVAEEPKKKRKSTRKKAAKKETAEETEAAPVVLNAREFEVQNIMDCKMSYEEMVAKFESSLVDDSWEDYKKSVLTELENIKVASDMNPGMLNVTLTQLNDLDRLITPDHSQFKALLETLTNKEDGICTCIRYQAMANGANENERRANGYYALTNATYEGEKINFINLIAGTRMKYIFLDSIKQRIKFMSNLCITFLGALKIENSMDIAINAVAK